MYVFVFCSIFRCPRLCVKNEFRNLAGTARIRQMWPYELGLHGHVFVASSVLFWALVFGPTTSTLGRDVPSSWCCPAWLIQLWARSECRRRFFYYDIEELWPSIQTRTLVVSELESKSDKFDLKVCLKGFSKFQTSALLAPLGSLARSR